MKYQDQNLILKYYIQKKQKELLQKKNLEKNIMLIMKRLLNLKIKQIGMRTQNNLMMYEMMLKS